MILNKLTPFLQKPAPYEKSTAEFWNDAHISKGMLEAHLNPEWDGATRKPDFVNQSVNWISTAFSPAQHPNLLDLGCGPGIYAEKFYKKAYQVTGVDFSERSIQYALESAQSQRLNIQYIIQDYLTLAYENKFDIATMIYCDFGVLPKESRNTLLRKIHSALNPLGMIIFDVFTSNFYKNKAEVKSWTHCDTGFYSPNPYIDMESFYRYDDCNTYLNQHIIITDTDVQCYNLWNHAFSTVELENDLCAAGFSNIEFFSNITGSPYYTGSNTICVTARKE